MSVFTPGLGLGIPLHSIQFFTNIFTSHLVTSQPEVTYDDVWCDNGFVSCTSDGDVFGEVWTSLDWAAVRDVYAQYAFRKYVV